MKRIAMVTVAIIGAMALTACGADNNTAEAAGQLPVELVALGDLPQLDQEGVQNQEDPEAEIDGSLVTDNTDPGKGSAAISNPDKQHIDNTGSSGKNHNNNSNAAATGSGNNSSPQSSSSGNTASGSNDPGTQNSGSSGSTASGNNDPGTQNSGSSGSNTPGNNDPGTQSSSSSGSTDNVPAVTPEHKHTWVICGGSGHYEEQITREAWDEGVYEERSICNQCGADITGNTASHTKVHALAGENGGWHSEWVQTETIHHEAETTQVWVQDSPGYWECSSCGARK